MTSQTAPVHVVDDDAAFRESLRVLLEVTGHEVQDYAGAAAFLDQAGPATRGCVLIDVNMPGLSGFGLQEQMAARGIELPVILMTAYADVDMAVRAMKAGAVDFIEKPFEVQALRDCIAAALAGEGDRAPDALELAAFRRKLEGLTDREREILEAMVEGHPSKVIAYRLGISPRTVHVHRAHISSKLGVRGLSRLVHLAVAAGIGPGAGPPGES